MVDLEWKANMVSSHNIPKTVNIRTTVTETAYEQFVRLPDLRKLWESREFPEWKCESILKPALHALEITFRFVSVVLSDHRHYSNRSLWLRRLDSLASAQLDIIASLADPAAPVAHLTSSKGLAPSSCAEVWRVDDGSTAVCLGSEGSLLPRLASWRTSEEAAHSIALSVERAMGKSSFTLGLGEPNLSCKPTLLYDTLCRPNRLHSALRRTTTNNNYETYTVYAALQMIECWARCASEVLRRISLSIEAREFSQAASDCFVVEQVWKLMAEIQDLHAAMDPNDLNKVWEAHNGTEDVALCLRSRGVVEMMHSCRDLRHTLPIVLGEKDAAELYSSNVPEERIRVHLLQGLQAIESSLKSFFYTCSQVVVGVIATRTSESLATIFLAPSYFPTLDAAKSLLPTT